ncbi:hypothetical protein NQ317_015153 [Molorchus minor]|uniref:Folylpoly-gamma-glutamate synthetase n=1 Tax=Molorchus minor TaxID=1323400 RepID=A0ABQ9K7Z9_9CUCU|nr:hypothetical protein NQ317_015153 [Molorchus minor]
MVFRSLRVGNNCVNTVSRTLVTLIDNMQKKSTRTYQEAIEALNRLQTNHQYIKDAAVKPKAETNIAEVKKFLERSGLSLDTLDQVPVIHVAGTNGKGTTCAYTESILRNHGYKTGFYSSPHLLDVRERIRINGLPISKTEFARHFWNIYDMLDRKKADNQDMPLLPRIFENKVDVAILEVGIGGEYDCTNVVRNTVVAGITPLDLDHTSLLGHSIESIAWNKAGIMKKKCVAFSTEQPEAAMNVLLERSLEKECSLTVVNYDYYKGGNNPRLPLHIQKTNASLALAISEAFIEKIVNDDHLKKTIFL